MKHFSIILALLLIICMGITLAESDSVAKGSNQAVQELEGMENLKPITADMLVDGVYPITVDTTSSMFHVEECMLTVENGEMQACMTMGGKGYLYVFMGTGEAAAEAEESVLIPFAEDASGRHTFTVPVEALDCALDCAAFSKKREQWYERKIVFRAASLPINALSESMVLTAEKLGLKDGSYTVDAMLSGGSGKTSIESPTELTVAGGKAYLKVVFSSKNYDYMIVDGEKYTFESDGGNSTFVIPAAVFDRGMMVVADTVAMGTPHEIEYTITIDSDSIVEVPQ